MEIGRQWQTRLRLWSEEFEKHYVAFAAPLEIEYYTTMEHLPFADALRGDFAPLPEGSRWGRKWEYAWFRTRVEIPAALAGQRLVFTLNTAPEMLVWVDGREAGAIDKKHRYITLTRSAVPGTVYEIVAEGYAGHGVRNEGAGIVGAGEQPVPEPKQPQVVTGASFLGIWNEPLFQTAMDYLTLYQLVQKLPEKSLRTMKIIEGLKKFTLAADFELPEPELTQSVVAADRFLKPLLSCKNGSTAPEFTVFGQSHLDMAWLWPVEETMRKTARTYSNQLALMREYPEYCFLLCEPPILEYLKELYPNVYSAVREKVAAGAFVPEGAMWIESDTNIPSGESLIRQLAWGQRWFRQELGVQSKIAWMPDTFGFSAALPQILKKCQVDYFATQKLVRQDPECDPFPYNIFWWEGVDGSRVLSHLFKKNNAVFNAGDLITRWEDDRVQQENIDSFLYPFGYGDGGGGPTREMLEMAARCADLEGAPRCRMESPLRFFQRLGNVEQEYRGELYLAWHRGTLTAQSNTKFYLRRAEIALKQTEMLLSRHMLAGQPMPENWQQRLQRLWQQLLFNQFHDIAAGASIRRVHQLAEEQLRQVIDGCAALRDELSEQAPREAFNHLSWPVWHHDRLLAPQSCRVLAAAPAAQARCLRRADGWVLENEKIVCRIDDLGRVVSVKMAGSAQEFLAAPGNELRMYRDVNTCYDAWELGSMYEKSPVELSGPVQLTAVQEPEGAALLLQRQVHESSLEQKIFLGNNASRLDFITRIDWKERHKLLKVCFPVNALAGQALHEIQFGYLARPTHRSRQHDRDQYEVCNHRYSVLSDGAVGAAVLNNGCYGVSTHDREICLSLLRAPLMPDQYADQGQHCFTYSFLPFTGDFRRSEVLHQAVELNEPLCMAQPLPETEPIFLPDAANVVVETVKPADRYENALLVRAYEAMGMQTDCAFTVHTSVRQVVETDMLEEQAREVTPGQVHFGPFEIKTFILLL